jgi:hypothetical protein
MRTSSPATALDSPAAPSTSHWWVLLPCLVGREALISAWHDYCLLFGLVVLATIIPTVFLTDFRTRNGSVLRSSSL